MFHRAQYPDLFHSSFIPNQSKITTCKCIICVINTPVKHHPVFARYFNQPQKAEQVENRCMDDIY